MIGIVRGIRSGDRGGGKRSVKDMVSYMKRMATTTLRIQIAPITILLAAIMLKVPFEVGLARRGGGEGHQF